VNDRFAHVCLDTLGTPYQTVSEANVKAMLNVLTTELVLPINVLTHASASVVQGLNVMPNAI